MDKHTYKVCLKKGSTYDEENYANVTIKDYWVTIKTDEKESENYVKYLAKDLLRKKVAKAVYGAYKFYKQVTLDNADMEVVGA